MNSELDKIADQLLKVGKEKTVAILRKVFKEWDENEDNQSGWKCETRYFMGLAVRSIDNDGEWEPW